MSNISTIGLLGAGALGSRLARLFAGAGCRVIVWDADQARVDAGLAEVSAHLGAADASAEQTQQVLSRIEGVTAVARLAEADLIVEAADEDAKGDLLARAAAVVAPSTPLVTTTSTLSVTELAAALPQPERVAGLHFFDTAPETRTVEVVRALRTDEQLVERLVDLVDGIDGKDPVVVPDRPGFLLNALLLPYLNDVIREYDRQLASAEDLDVALELGLGYRTGPLRLLDRIGLDTHLRATDALYTATRDDRYAAPPLLRQMVAAGRLGERSGGGFHTSTTDSE